MTGLSVDFVAASFYGFLCYSVYNVSLYFNEHARDAYRTKHEGKDNLVSIMDVLFAVHSMMLAFVFCVQVLIFRKPNEGPSLVGIGLSVGLTAVITGGAVFVFMGVLPMLTYLYAMTWTKLIMTVLKYVPQVWLNWVRRSTSGWSIANVLLDFIGGILSIAQLFLDALIDDNMSGITGHFSKLALGVISIAFDVIFMLQHYVWFSAGRGPHIVTMVQLDDALLSKDEGSIRGATTTPSIDRPAAARRSNGKRSVDGSQKGGESPLSSIDSSQKESKSPRM